MAGLRAIFSADFQSFTNAVKRAELDLKDLETDAGKVQDKFNSVANSFSGKKIVQDANLVTEAIARIGGASQLTAAEQARVNKTLTEALAKYKAIGETAPKAMLDLAAATQRVRAPLEQAGTGSSFLLSTFSQFTAAGLATQAISKITTEFSAFIETGLKLPAVERSFGRLTSSMKQDGAAMLANMTTASKGMVSNYDLMLSANKAILLDIPVTSASMGELAKTATILGRAMGKDATSSIDDLITALGRSSPRILDNLGLMVKVGEANDAYAKKLGKSSESLTDAEQKMAFYEAAMEAARKKTAELGDASKTLGEIVTTAWTQIGNTVSSGSGMLNVSIGRIISSQKGLREFAMDMLETADVHAAIFRALARAKVEAGGTATSEFEARMKRELSAADAAKAGLKTYTDELKQAQASYAGLTAEQKKNLSAAFALNTSTTDIAKSMKLSESVVTLAKQAHDAHAQAVRKDAAESRQYADAVSAMFGKLGGGNDLTKQIKILDEAVRRLASSGTLTAKQIDEIAKEALKLSEQGAVLTPRLWDIVLATGQLGPGLNKAAIEFRKLGTSLPLPELDAYNMALARMASLGGVTSGLTTDKPQDFRTEVVSIKEMLKGVIGTKKDLDELADLAKRDYELMMASGVNAYAALAAASKRSFEAQLAAMGGLKGSLAQSLYGSLDGLSAGLTNAIKGNQSVGSAFADYGTSVATSFTENALGVIPVIGPMLAKFAGPIVEGAKKLFSSIFDIGTAGRDTITDFAKSLTGSTDLNALHKLLTEQLPSEAEKYWIILTQGTGRNNAAQAAANIKLVQDALANSPAAAAAAAGYKTQADLDAIAKKAKDTYDYMLSSGKYSASEIAKAFQASKDAQIAAMGDSAKAQQDALDEITGKYKESIDKLDAEYKSLSDSVSKEAEEEFMGVVETQERARMKQIEDEKKAKEKERDDAIKAKEDEFAGMLEAGQKVDLELRKIFGKSLEIPYRFVPENSPGGYAPPSGSGTYTPPRPPAGGPSASRGGGTAVIVLDGRVLAEASVPHIPGVVKKYVGR